MSGGKGGGSQIVGYRYYMGMHLAVCHGPVDALTEVVVGERSAWTGNVTASGRLTLAADSLFGGDKSQGGISGAVDVALGESTLAPNDYLVAKIGAPQPAYRGVFSLIGRQLFIGSNNPYAKPWWVRVRRAPKGWYATAASITMPGGVVAANPAHILVECLTNAVWGMGYSINAIDDAGFRVAADQLTAEGFGLNLQWSQQTTIEQFVQMVVDHIGAVLAVRPDTGQFTLTLLRGGYNAATLPLFNPDNILELADYQRASWGETTGELIVTYTRHDNGKDTSVAVQDLANIQAQGGVVSQTRRYPGISDDALAARVAMRDLASLSVPLAKVQIKTNRQAWNLLPGGLFRLDWPVLGIAGLVLRVAGIDTGTLADGTIVIDAVEDVFGLPSASYTAPQPSGWANPVQAPAAATPRLLVETPYYDLVRAMSQADLANLAATDCYVYALAGKPSPGAYNAQLYTKASSQTAYAARQVGGWTQTAQLGAALPRAVSSAGVPYTGTLDSSQWTLGGYALIDAEVVQITAINTTAGTFDCNRGVLDTVPATHAAGATVWLADGRQIGDKTPWTVGETVNAKLLTTTGLGTLALASAPVDNITFAQRQNRPYAPGNFTLNAAAYPAAILGALTTAWGHRDRVQQADNIILQNAANIGPETGVSYALTVYGEAGTALRTLTGLTGTSDPWALADEITASALTSPAPARVLVAGSLPDYSATVLADTPLAFWKLNEATGTAAADSSGNALAGTYTGGYTLGAAPPSNAPGAVLLNGSTGYINCGTPAALNITAAWTLEAWIYLTSTPNGAGIICEAFTGAGNNVLYAMSFSTAAGATASTLMAGFYTGSAWKAVAGPTPSLNAWHHACATWDGTTLLLYLDGAQVASLVPGVAPVAGNNGIYVGRRWDASGAPYFPGRMASAAIYGTALTAARISAHYSAGIAASSASISAQARANGSLRALLLSQRGGLNSLQSQDHTTKRAGYGYQYGNFYGGI